MNGKRGRNGALVRRLEAARVATERARVEQQRLERTVRRLNRGERRRLPVRQPMWVRDQGPAVAPPLRRNRQNGVLPPPPVFDMSVGGVDRLNRRIRRAETIEIERLRERRRQPRADEELRVIVEPQADDDDVSTVPYSDDEEDEFKDIGIVDEQEEGKAQFLNFIVKINLRANQGAFTGDLVAERDAGGNMPGGNVRLDALGNIVYRAPFVRHMSVRIPPGVRYDNHIIKLLAEEYFAENIDEDNYDGVDVEVASVTLDPAATVEYNPAITYQRYPMNGTGDYVGDVDFSKGTKKTGNCVMDVLLFRADEHADHRRDFAPLCNKAKMVAYFTEHRGWEPGGSLGSDDVLAWAAEAEYVKGLASIYLYGIDSRCFKVQRGTRVKTCAFHLRITDHHCSLLQRDLSSLGIKSLGMCKSVDVWNNDISDFAVVNVLNDAWRSREKHDDPDMDAEVRIGDFVDMLGDMKAKSGELSTQREFLPNLSDPKTSTTGVLLHIEHGFLESQAFILRLIARLTSRLGKHFPLKWDATNSICGARIGEDFYLMFSSANFASKELLDLMRASFPELPLHVTQPRNQTVTSLAIDYYQSVLGEVPMSTMNPVVFDILAQCKRGGHIEAREDIVGGETRMIDESKSYACSLMANQDPYTVVNVCNDFEHFEYEGEIPSGMYVLRCPLSLNTVTVDDVVYPDFVVRLALQQKRIDASDISMVLRADRILPANTYRKPAEDLFSKTRASSLDVDATWRLVKPLTNCWVGANGTVTHTKVYGGMTRDKKLVESHHGAALSINKKTALHTMFNDGNARGLVCPDDIRPVTVKVDGLYFVSYSVTEPKRSNNMLIWMHTVWQAKIRLSEIAYNFGVMKCSGFQTDCIYTNHVPIDVCEAFVACYNVDWRERHGGGLAGNAGELTCGLAKRDMTQSSLSVTRPIRLTRKQAVLDRYNHDHQQVRVTDRGLEVVPPGTRMVDYRLLPDRRWSNVFIEDKCLPGCRDCAAGVRHVPRQCMRQCVNCDGDESHFDVMSSSLRYTLYISACVDKNEEYDPDDPHARWYRPEVSADELPDMLGDEESCLITGGPGCGKTFLARLMYTEDTLVLCAQCRPLDVFKTARSDEVVFPVDVIASNCKTIDSVLTHYRQNMQRAAEWVVQTFKRLMVDEYSQLSSRHLTFLMYIRDISPAFQILLFGDIEQCRAVVRNGNVYELTKSYVLRYIACNNLFRIPYRENANRFSPELKEAVDSFLDEGVVSPHFGCAGDAEIHLYARHICSTNAHKVTIDKICMDYFNSHPQPKEVLLHVEAKTSYKQPYVQNLDLTVGFPLMAHRTNAKLGYINTQTFTVEGMQGSKIILCRDDDPSIKVQVSPGVLAVEFSCGFAMTAHRAQGLTIEHPYMVHIDEHSQKAGVYVALSRGRQIDHVVIHDSFQEDWNRVFEPEPYEVVARVIQPHGTVRAIIYSCVDPEDGAEFIGLTTVDQSHVRSSWVAPVSVEEDDDDRREREEEEEFLGEDIIREEEEESVNPLMVRLESGDVQPPASSGDMFGVFMVDDDEPTVETKVSEASELLAQRALNLAVTQHLQSVRKSAFEKRLEANSDSYVHTVLSDARYSNLYSAQRSLRMFVKQRSPEFNVKGQSASEKAAKAAKKIAAALEALELPHPCGTLTLNKSKKMITLKIETSTGSRAKKIETKPGKEKPRVVIQKCANFALSKGGLTEADFQSYGGPSLYYADLYNKLYNLSGDACIARDLLPVEVPAPKEVVFDAAFSVQEFEDVDAQGICDGELAFDANGRCVACANNYYCFRHGN